MGHALTEQQIKRTFRAIAAGFFVLGLTVPTMLSQFPTLMGRLDLEEWHVTFFLLSMAFGAVPSLIGGSFLIGRFGSKLLSSIFLPLFLAFPVLYILAPNYGALLSIGFCLGICTGFFDVAANSQGSLLERVTNRFFMTGVHAMFAAGVLSGTLLAFISLYFGMPIWLFFLLISLASSTLLFFIRRDFLSFSIEAASDEEALKASGGKLPKLSRNLLIGLCLLMLLGIEAEASHYDWLSQYFFSEFKLKGQNLDAHWFVLPMVLFSSGLLIARLLGDGIAEQIGRPKLLLFGTLIGMAGLLWLIITHKYWEGVVAVFFMGFGFSFFFPIFVASAGRLNGVRPAFGVAIVSAMGWASIFIGPPLIGFLEHFYGFRWAYASIVPVAALVAIFGPWVVFKSRAENH